MSLHCTVSIKKNLQSRQCLPPVVVQHPLMCEQEALARGRARGRRVEVPRGGSLPGPAPLPQLHLLSDVGRHQLSLYRLSQPSGQHGGDRSLCYQRLLRVPAVLGDPAPAVRGHADHGRHSHHNWHLPSGLHGRCHHSGLQLLYLMIHTLRRRIWQKGKHYSCLFWSLLSSRTPEHNPERGSYRIYSGCRQRCLQSYV